MFRKLKTKNIRQRTRIDNAGDEDDDLDNFNTVKSDKLEREACVLEVKDEDLTDDDTIIQESIVKPKSKLSFDEDEGDDIIDFKLKRSSRQSDKSSKKKHSHKRSEVNQFSTKVVKKEIMEDEIMIVMKLKPQVKNKPGRTKFKIPEKLDDDAENGSVNMVDDPEADIRSKFASAFTDIPDAKAVYEARKKREQLRQGNGYIPLDDTIRLKSNNSKRSGERSRLVREDDDNDLSDDDNLQGKFYSSSSVLITEEEQRRSEQTIFLKMEQGISDVEEDDNSDEDELVRWEREQIRKGVSVQKVNQLQNEINATSQFYRSVNDDVSLAGGQSEMDVDVEIIDNSLKKPRIILPDGSLPGSSGALTLEDVLASIEAQITHRRENSNATELSLRRVEDNLNDNAVSIRQLESSNPNLQQRFQMFQEMRLYTRDLLECLNEKIEEINSFDEQILTMWKKRLNRLIKRGRQDVQDQYERCAAISSGRQWVIPSPEYAIREAEREGRRNRRKRDREKNNVLGHHEGLSSDDEETTSQNVIYSDTIASLLEKAVNVFIDTADDFCDIKKIMNRFIDWHTVDQKSYDEAYISLCLPKIIAPFVRLELLDWKPLQSTDKPLHTHEWYKKLLTVGLDNMSIDFENDEIVNFIPLVVEKVILPKIAKIIDEQWNPLSLTESRNIASLLKTIIDEYPTASATSKRMLDILNLLYKKAKISIDEDMFVPIYSKEAIEAPETGCSVFLDRQFWKSIKLIRSLLCFRNLLSNNCLEELIIEGVVNRSAVLALQLSSLADPLIIFKCSALVGDIPSQWLPTSKPQSYRPLAALITQIIEQHRFRDRDFYKQMQKFLNSIRKE